MKEKRDLQGNVTCILSADEVAALKNLNDPLVDSVFGEVRIDQGRGATLNYSFRGKGMGLKLLHSLAERVAITIESEDDY
jgi:hypothetical protein